jgi:hypothetical protein
VAVPAAAADMHPFTRGSWAELRAAHAGRPAIVLLWGLSRAPCIAELPRWGELALERQGLDLVLVAADPLADNEPRIAAALAKAGLPAILHSYR